MNNTNTPSRDFSRRDFIATTAVAGTVLLTAPALLAQPTAPVSHRKRYALVGVGSRSGMYREAVLKTYAEHCEMVGFCDINEGRLEAGADARRGKWPAVEVPRLRREGFRPDDPRDQDRTSSSSPPRTATHDDYIIRAMELGCDVMTEKPMTTDEKKCQRHPRRPAQDRPQHASSPSTTATRRRAPR